MIIHEHDKCMVPYDLGTVCALLGIVYFRLILECTNIIYLPLGSRIVTFSRRKETLHIKTGSPQTLYILVKVDDIFVLYIAV